MLQEVQRATCSCFKRMSVTCMLLFMSLFLRDGVYDAIPVYDKALGRFLVTATCSGKGAVLLAVTATADPTGGWFLFTLVADGAGTAMECTSPRETAIADSVRLTYDANGVYLSL